MSVQSRKRKKAIIVAISLTAFLLFCAIMIWSLYSFLSSREVDPTDYFYTGESEEEEAELVQFIDSLKSPSVAGQEPEPDSTTSSDARYSQLHEALDNSDNVKIWIYTVIEMAKLGESPEAYGAVLDFIRRGDMHIEDYMEFDRACMSKMNALMYLPYVGGDDALEFLKDILFSQDTPPVTKEWIDRLHEVNFEPLDADSAFANYARKWAAVDLVFSDNVGYNNLVRQYYDELKASFKAGTASKVDTIRLGIMADVLAMGDLRKQLGENYILDSQILESSEFNGLVMREVDKYLDYR